MRTIYTGGDILTLTGKQPQAVLVEDGVIRALGDLTDMPAGCKKEHLAGGTLMPAFIDGHSHLTAYAQTLGLAHLEGARSFRQIEERLRKFMAEDGGEGWVIGFGYDHNQLQEGRHPDRALLDQISPDRPLMVTHQSGHMGVMNSLALAAAGISAQTPDPEGGRIGRDSQGQPTGYAEETAFLQASASVPAPGPQALMRQLERAQRAYLKYGIATAQDGKTGKDEWALLQGAAGQGRLLMDVVAYADITQAPDLPQEKSQYVKRYVNHLKLGGYKMFLDGSPQGRTAWLSQPYLSGEAGYRGYPTLADDKAQAYMDKAEKEDIQMLAHCNGDAAAQQMIDCYRRSLAKYHRPIRPVMIHAQLLRPDQMKEMADLGMIASFFTAHTWYWGDAHRSNLGNERALRISAAHSALEKGLPFTFHQDTPVIEPNMLETVWCAVNRVSRTGADMGQGQRISAEQALKAVTVNAAWQVFEEGEKGAIEPGMRADLVVLSHNPMKINPERIKEIQVSKTIVGGKVAYEG